MLRIKLNRYRIPEKLKSLQFREFVKWERLAFIKYQSPHVSNTTVFVLFGSSGGGSIAIQGEYKITNPDVIHIISYTQLISNRDIQIIVE